MKTVIFGSTGLAGSAILNACLAHNSITKIYLVSRRALGDERDNNPKVEVILHNDFSQYPPELMAKLQGTELCFWAIGGMVNKFDNDKKRAHDANVVFPKAAATALLEHLPKDSPSGKIRFVLTSGMYTEQDLGRRLYFLNDSRKQKGEIENFLQQTAEANPDRFETWAARPGLIIPQDPPFSTKMTAMIATGITAEHLGRVMVKVGVEGWKDRVLEQDVMLKIN